VRAGIEDLPAFIKAQQYFDLPACLFPVGSIPDLPAFIFAYIEADLPATITGVLAQLDLAARLQIVQEDLGGIILGIAAPSLPATIFSQYGTNLGGLIWTPTDLPATLAAVNANDVLADIFAFQFSDMPASVLSIAAPKLFGYIRGFAAGQKNLPSLLSAGDINDLGAIVTGDPLNQFDLAAILSAFTDTGDLPANIDSFALLDLKATLGIEVGNEFDLPATIDFFSAKTLPASIGVWLLGEHDKFLPASLQPGNDLYLPATIGVNDNLKNLSAYIEALSGFSDLGAFLRVSETFVTAILTVSTMNAADLRATIGRPGCAGGSANAVLGAMAVVQHAFDLPAFIESYIEANLGAAINQEEIFYSIDSIPVSFTPTIPRLPNFLTTDTINVVFSPFRGLNLGATISAIQANADLAASISVAIPLPRVEPAVNTITAKELRPDRLPDTQEVRLQLEGQLLDYFYVNGTEDAFIRDSSETWKLNVRSFREISAELFGDRAAGRVCRLGSLTPYLTMDEAVRACISAVIGVQGELDMSAYLNASGGTTPLPASLSVSDVFYDMNALANRVFPEDLSATITGTP
jgi:hypothetical protein